MKSKTVILVLFLAILSFFANIWGISIYSLDEAKNAECAREMLERRNFIVPTFNYELRTDKPPMHYYFMIFAYKLFGVNEFAARFFSSLFGVLTVLATFFFARRFFNEKVAFFSSLVLLASLHTSIQFHMAVPDPYLIFFITASLMSFFIFYKEKSQTALWLFYLFSGFAVLTKGPVGVVLPFFIVLFFLAITHHLWLLRKMSIFKGLLLITAVSLPWYVAVGVETNWVWVKEFIFKHNIHRFSSPMEGHGGIFLITLLYVFIGLLPFSVYLLQSFKKAWVEKFKDVNLFLLIWAVIYVGFFAVSKTKLPNYTVPSYPTLAIILGSLLATVKFRKSFVYSLATYILITVLLAIGAYIGLKQEPEIKDLAYLGFSFFFLTVVGLVSLVLLKKDFKKSHFTLGFGSFLFVLAFFFLIFPLIDRRNPVQQELPLIDKTKPIISYKGFNPAFLFYIRKKIPEFNRVDKLKKFLKDKSTVYILTRKKHLKELEKIKGLKILAVKKDLFERKYSVLIIYRR